jgi:hypothetical protein
MYTLKEALIKIAGTENDVVCIRGRYKGVTFNFLDGVLHCEEPDGTGYVITNGEGMPYDSEGWIIEDY